MAGGKPCWWKLKKDGADARSSSKDELTLRTFRADWGILILFGETKDVRYRYTFRSGQVLDLDFMVEGVKGE